MLRGRFTIFISTAPAYRRNGMRKSSPIFSKKTLKRFKWSWVGICSAPRGLCAAPRRALPASWARAPTPANMTEKISSDTLPTSAGFWQTKPPEPPSENVFSIITTPGWIWAEEASGTAIGKRFLYGYYRGKIPPAMAKKVKDTCHLELDDTLEKVYSGQKPGTFIAGFCKFIGENIKEEYCANLVKDCFRQFFTEIIVRYPSHQKSPIHFTGSIAFHFADLLKEIAAEYKTAVGKILKGPMDELVEYHRTHS